MKTAFYVCATFGLANGYVVPEMFKRGIDFTLSASQCDVSTAETSCGSSGSSSSADLCCLEQQGLIVQTQFWDSDVSGSPESFTIHGLWPDKCDGSYQASCDYSSSVSSVLSVLQDAGETDLLAYMNSYWINNSGSSDELFTHEFNKHGTCMSTLGSSCYLQGSAANANVVDFAKLTVKTFQSLPTYDWLSAAGITPSSSTTYNADDITSALSAKFGQKVYIGCKNGQLNEVWYFHTVKGSLLNDDLVKIDAVASSTCRGSVQYLPKNSA